MSRFKSTNSVITGKLDEIKMLSLCNFRHFSINYKLRRIIHDVSPLISESISLKNLISINKTYNFSIPKPLNLLSDEVRFTPLPQLDFGAHFHRNRKSLTHLLTMKILIHKKEFVENPINVDLLVKHLMRKGLKTKFLKMFTNNFNHYAELDTCQHLLPCAVDAIELSPMSDHTLTNTETDASIESMNCISILPLKQHIFNNINSITPIFVLISEKVSKKVRKFTRGKSGRYTQFWVYLPPHKRQSWLCKQLTKEISFRTEKKLQERVKSALYELLDDPDKHYLNKQILGVYQIIFKNYRQTLMKTYRRERRLVPPQN